MVRMKKKTIEIMNKKEYDFLNRYFEKNDIEVISVSYEYLSENRISMEQVFGYPIHTYILDYIGVDEETGIIDKRYGSTNYTSRKNDEDSITLLEYLNNTTEYIDLDV